MRQVVHYVLQSLLELGYCYHGLINYKVPRWYESIRRHYAQTHPEALASYEAGWNALPPAIQRKWTDEGNRAIAPEVATRCTTWPQYLFSCIFEAIGRRRKTRSIEDVLRPRLEHTGSIFGQPRPPHVPSNVPMYSDPNMGPKEFISSTLMFFVKEYFHQEWKKTEAKLIAEIEEKGLEAWTSRFDWDCFIQSVEDAVAEVSTQTGFLGGENSEDDAEDFGSSPIPIWDPPATFSSEDGSVDSEDNE
jgi:hypothetical protein